MKLFQISNSNTGRQKTHGKNSTTPSSFSLRHFSWEKLKKKNYVLPSFLFKLKFHVAVLLFLPFTLLTNTVEFRGLSQCFMDWATAVVGEADRELTCVTLTFHSSGPIYETSAQSTKSPSTIKFYIFQIFFLKILNKFRDFQKNWGGQLKVKKIFKLKNSRLETARTQVFHQNLPLPIKIFPKKSTNFEITQGFWEDSS